MKNDDGSPDRDFPEGIVFHFIWRFLQLHRMKGGNGWGGGCRKVGGVGPLIRGMGGGIIGIFK